MYNIEMSVCSGISFTPLIFGGIGKEDSQNLDKIEGLDTMQSLVKDLVESESLEKFNARLDKYIS